MDFKTFLSIGKKVYVDGLATSMLETKYLGDKFKIFVRRVLSLTWSLFEYERRPPKTKKGTILKSLSPGVLCHQHQCSDYSVVLRLKRTAITEINGILYSVYNMP